MNKSLAVAGFAFLVIVSTLVIDGFLGTHTDIRLNGKTVEPRTEDQVWLGDYMPDQDMTPTVTIANNTFSSQKVTKPSLKIFTMALVSKPDINPVWNQVREFPSESVVLQPFQTITFTYKFRTEWKGQYRLVLEDGQTVTINFNVW